MKKLLSIILSVAMLCTMLSAFGLTVSAAEVQEKYYYYTVDSTGNIQHPNGVDTIDTDLYDIEEKQFTALADTRLDIYQITEPCVIYGYFECHNKDQVESMPMALNYEIALTIGEPKDIEGGEYGPTYDWCDYTYPKYGADYGDYEYLKLEVTKADILAAGGEVSVYFGVRAQKYKSTPLSEIGQIFNAGVRIYTAKNVKDIKNPETAGDSNITMNGNTIPAPTYTVTIPEKIEFGNVSKKLKSVADIDAIAETYEYTVTADYEYLFENQKNLTVTMSTDNQIKNGNNSIAFNLYKDDNTSLTSGNTIFAIQPTAVEKNTATQKIYATLDQREIKASGDYTGTVTFTVTLADNK